MEKVLKIISLKSKEIDYSYWLTKTEQDRISAIEILRQQYFSLNKNAQQRFQRICRIINTK
jgi:hypothetical protein